MNSERNIIDCYNMMDIPLRHVIIQINLIISEIQKVLLSLKLYLIW